MNGIVPPPLLFIFSFSFSYGLQTTLSRTRRTGWVGERACRGANLYAHDGGAREGGELGLVPSWLTGGGGTPDMMRSVFRFP